MSLGSREDSGCRRCSAGSDTVQRDRPSFPNITSLLQLALEPTAPCTVLQRGCAVLQRGCAVLQPAAAGARAHGSSPASASAPLRARAPATGLRSPLPGLNYTGGHICARTGPSPSAAAERPARPPPCAATHPAAPPAIEHGLTPSAQAGMDTHEHSHIHTLPRTHRYYSRAATRMRCGAGAPSACALATQTRASRAAPGSSRVPHSRFARAAARTEAKRKPSRTT